jgi:tRNA(Ile)-lysidine synthase
MLAAVQHYIQQHKLFYVKNKLIVAVSGGVDSMVLLHILAQIDVTLIVAHCNFKLRNTASDLDEKLVADAVKTYNRANIHLESITFDTKTYAETNKISIQEAARKLRYDWFELLRTKHQAQAIVTAHHLNDNIETLLFNISKGTGIKGIRGILPKQNKIVRPLIASTKAEILSYANEFNIAFREDESNKEDKYHRNAIRHHVIPTLQKINPQLEQNFKIHFERFQAIDLFYQAAVEKYTKELITYKHQDAFISILQLKKIPGFESLLFELLRTYGINSTQVENIIQSFEITDTKVFFSHTHRLVKDKKHLIISDIAEVESQYLAITSNATKVKLPKNELIRIHQKPIKKLTKISEKAHFAYLDFEKLAFPLVLRRWKDGDYFYPFGLYCENGQAKKKKLKKYFSDMKLSLIEKENVWVLCSGERIVWLVNHRIDDRFKLTENTKVVYQLKWLN